MNFSLVYLVSRFFYRIREFILDWYLGSFRQIGRLTINFLESLDQFLAWKITLKNLFEPLYQDHTILGHTLGFIFRSVRIFLASVIYAAVIALAILIFLIWAAIPPYLIYRGFF